MSHRDWKYRIDNINNSICKIIEYVEGVDYDLWKEDRKTIDAVVQNFEIIGEAANNVPEEIQNEYPDVPWCQMKGMRNILIHEYFGVDL